MTDVLDHVRIRAEAGDELARKHLEGVARIMASASPPPSGRDGRLDRIMACPDRGSVLPVSQQGEGCCGSPELTECRRGIGKIPGRVSLANCLECVEMETGRGIPRGPDSFVAPRRDADAVAMAVPRPWEGRVRRKPWEYRITAAIVHLDTPDLLEAVVETLRRQTVPPYILVYDAGSIGENRARLEEWAGEAEDVEVCFHRPKAWRWTSEPVAVGMDWAFGRCQTDVLYATHTDVFLRRPDYLEYLLGLCGEKTPVVGYRMSSRDFVPEAAGKWRGIAGHTQTAYWMPTMLDLGVTWSMRRANRMEGRGDGRHVAGWPDTETALGLAMARAGIGHRWPWDAAPGPDDPPSQLFLGTEPNRPYANSWAVHERSYTGQSMYSAQAKAARQARVRQVAAEAVVRARSW